MKYTNKFNLPQAFVKACSNEKHNKEGCYSATTLLKGGCEVMLTKRHWDEIEVDVSDCVWRIFGTAVHKIFEEAGIDGFAEESFEVPVSESKVTGKIDLYDMENEIVYDWKTASTWKWTYKDFGDWNRQGLIYAWLLKQNGLKAKEIQFVALFKDHSKSKARFDSTYPQAPVLVHTVKVTEKALEEIEKFIFDKVKEFEQAEKLTDENLFPCSSEERWASADTWAIMKKGRKSVLKVCNSEEEAKELLTIKGGDSIEFRKGESKKCIDGYCSCRNFCPFYKKNQ